MFKNNHTFLKIVDFFQCIPFKIHLKAEDKDGILSTKLTSQQQELVRSNKCSELSIICGSSAAGTNVLLKVLKSKLHLTAWC